MQLVVVMAVKNAVSAATITFTATSIILFFIVYFLFTFIMSGPRARTMGTVPAVFYFVKRRGTVPSVASLSRLNLGQDRRLRRHQYYRC